MASLISHIVVAVAAGQAIPPSERPGWHFWILAILCSILPDFDVIGFHFGIRYGDLWGHRGLTHSLLFAVIFGFVAALAARPCHPGGLFNFAALFGLITFSHGLLDAITNGGLGVAFFSPFDTKRYFFPWRPIEVSPIGLHGFLTHRGLEVLRSEALFIWGPALVLGLLLRSSYRKDLHEKYSDH